MKICILGYMGSGKSTVGARLAKEAGCPFTDLDHYIEQMEGCSIPQIFAYKGETYFRECEKKYLTKFIEGNEHFVLSLGGGTPCFLGNMDYLKGKAISVYLDGTVDTLFSRLRAGRTSRPLITQKDDMQLRSFIEESLAGRCDHYRKADIVIGIDGKSPREIVTEIMERIPK